MLSKQAFIAGIAVIKKAFIGWQFDLNDMVQVNLWYSAFANLTDNQFTGLINEYIKNNKQPPMSIKALSDVFVDRQIKLAKMPPEKAFSYVRELISDCGGWEYGGKSEIYKKLAAYPTLRETVKEFEGTLKTMSANDPYTENRFRKAYEERLRQSATKKVSEFLSLPAAPKENKALGSGTLPYEE